jgi:hypothetical protein
MPVDIRSEANKRGGSIRSSITIRPPMAACIASGQAGSCARTCASALKRIMPQRLMLAAEYVMQVPCAPLAFGPTILHGQASGRDSAHGQHAPVVAVGGSSLPKMPASSPRRRGHHGSAAMADRPSAIRDNTSRSGGERAQA